ncbi:MAG: type IV toxin-antitoxin system AbiEi family antitoxin domain-containing protein [Propionibacteriaceae bacterium]
MGQLISDPHSGYSFDELRRMVHAGEAIRVRPGTYLIGSSNVGALDLHRQAIRGTVPRIAADAVVSHTSAAVLHDLPVWDVHLDKVHFTRPRAYGGRRLRWLHLHVAPIDAVERATIDGIGCTSLSRTVVDAARTLSARQAVALGDRALRRGLDPARLTWSLARAKGWPGVPRARRVVDFLDARSESPGESHSRVILSAIGCRPSHTQYEVRDLLGRVVARTDFCWEEQRTVGEFDGRIKYGRDLNPGQDIEEVLFEEKRREDAIRDLGWQVVRWTWPDLATPRALHDRVQRAFARSSRAG